MTLFKLAMVNQVYSFVGIVSLLELLHLSETKAPAQASHNIIKTKIYTLVFTLVTEQIMTFADLGSAGKPFICNFRPRFYYPSPIQQSVYSAFIEW